MPPRKRRTVTIPSSSDHDNDRRESSVQPPARPKANSRKQARGPDDDSAPKRPRGRPRKATVEDSDDEPSAKKPKRKPRKLFEEDEEDDLLEKPAKKQKLKAHEPTGGAELQELYLTQLPQDTSSPPWRIRGPIWQKQKEPPPVVYRPPVPAYPQAVESPAAPYQKVQNTALQPPRSQTKGAVSNAVGSRQPGRDSPRKAENPAPFYSSPLSTPGKTAPRRVQNSSLPGSPVQEAADTVDRGTRSKPQGRPTPQPNRPKMGAVLDLELDSADFFSSSPPSPPRQAPAIQQANDALNDEAKITPSLPVLPGKPASLRQSPPVEDLDLDPADFSSSPPSPPKKKPRDGPLGDDVEERYGSVINAPTKADSAARTDNVANNSMLRPENAASNIDPELADLPSDAFSSSSVSSAAVRALERDRAEAILISSQDNFLPTRPQHLAAPLNGLRQTTLFGGADGPITASQLNKVHNWPLANKEEPPTHHKLDLEAMKTWVYPTNLGKIRDYQYNIAHRGLYHNLLVALPTGLGKTFIAATIMLNWLRWTVDAQVIFVAPTKPLVAQQIDACLGIAGIRRSETTMLTGEVTPALREEEYKTKRVFFMTPQTLVNDLKIGVCDAKKIVLIVVDEAHRATGGYAYVEIVKFIRRFNQSFRVLALTATPGSTVEAVQKVIDGLEISRVEIRTEGSLDIRPFIQTREVEKVVLRDNKDLLVVKDLFTKAVQPVMAKLSQQNAYWSRDPLNISQYGLQQARDRWMKSDAGRGASHGLKGMVNAIFQALISLGRGVDVLKFHGIRPFYRILKDYKADATTKSKKEITGNPSFDKLMNLLQTWTAKPDFLGHPKLERLRTHVLNHFLDAGEGKDPANSRTKVMVFAHWRDSAEDIVRVLKLNEPLIRPHVFVGQAATKTSEAMDQRRQDEVVKQFKAGVYNTLVATSIGEEGLDIGEVDLIVCYDQKASPIRMLQRMGRTGRKRRGKILLLQMEGKEEDDALMAKDAYEKMQEKIGKGDEFNFHTEIARRIVPKDINPIVDKRQIEIPIENSQAELPMPRAGKRGKTKRPAKKFQMPDGVETGFVTASRMNGGSDGEGQGRAKKKSKKVDIIDPPEPPVPLEEAYLDKHEEKMLQRFYQNINDADDDREIAPPALSLHPERQRRESRTRYISKHSKLTVAFVNMVNRMHRLDDARIGELRSNLHMSDLDTGPSADEISEDEVPGHDGWEEESPVNTRAKQSHNRIMDEVGEGGSSSPPPTDPRMRIRSQAIDLGTQDTEGEDEFEDEQLDSELADFIADDGEPVETFSSSLPSVQRRRPTKLFTSSQKDAEDSDEELPEISQIVRGDPGGRAKKVAPVMVADSDEDEDDSEPVARQTTKRRKVVEDSESE